jgi:hypothetical protein
MLLNADDKGKVNISRTKKRTKEKKKRKEERREKEEERKKDRNENISIKKTQVHLVLDSGVCVIRRREQL